ncbi:MAG: hypothetical protein COA44_01370 [Arcobacter sp.]|nr:MAG: hypothetical protein COA44_01370 [Arcobacter sp.]
MTHNDDYINNKVKFTLSSVALAFCLVWALIGESDIKILAVTIAFMCFLQHGIATEMSARQMDDSH